jgi:cytochrome P450
MRSLPPKRDGLPVLGSALSFRRDPYAFYADVASRGDVVRFDIANVEMVAVLHPDQIEQVLVKKFDQYRKPDNAGGVEVLADGLLLTDGERWQRQRSQLQPLFYRERVETYAETMGAYAAAAADEWCAADAPVDVADATAEYTLRVLGKTLFGIETDDRREAVRAGARAIRERSSDAPGAVAVPEWLPTPGNRRYRRGISQLESVIDALLDKRESAADGDDLLSLLQAATGPDGPSEDEIRSQLATFLFAGHETSATALTWALYELGRRPDVARQLAAEVEEVVTGEYATLAELPALEYTDRFLRETLRRYPPAAAIFRETDTAVTLGGYRLPADTFVVIPQFHVHTDDRWWNDPHRFDPLRWDSGDDSDSDRPEYAYFPFGGGPRHCIGMRFARLELKVALATIVHRARVTHDLDKVDIDVGSTVQPAPEIYARFSQRSPTKTH